MNGFHLLINEYIQFIQLFDYKYILIPILVVIAALIVVMYFIYLSQCFIHELGHMIFGLLSGCKVLSFRIGNYAIVKENSQIRIKIHKVKGSGGQCLLGEPKRNYMVSQYFIILGGVIFNICLSITSYIISFHASVVIKAICYLSCFVGMVFIVMNGLPLNCLSILNDGKCLMLVRNNRDAQRYYYIQSKICRLLFESVSYGDMPEECMIIEGNSQLDNELIGYLALVRYYHYLENKEYKMAIKCLSQFEPYEKRMGKEELIDLYYEKLYIELLTLKREYVIEALINSNILVNDFNIGSNYSNTVNNDINRLRVRMAYELIYTKNNLRGMQHYVKAKSLLNKHQAAGEVKFQYAMLHRIL